MQVTSILSFSEYCSGALFKRAKYCSNGQITVPTGRLLFQRQVTVPTGKSLFKWANHCSNGHFTVPTGRFLFQRDFAFQAYLRHSSKPFERSRTSREIVILLYHFLSLKLVFVSLELHLCI